MPSKKSSSVIKKVNKSSKSSSRSRSKSSSRSRSDLLVGLLVEPSNKSMKNDYSELIIRKKIKEKSKSSYNLSSLKIVKINNDNDKTPFILFPKKV